MKLIDDNHIKMTGIDRAESVTAQALNAREDVVVLNWLVAPSHQLAEGRISEDFSVGPAGLLENLASMGDE